MIKAVYERDYYIRFVEIYTWQGTYTVGLYSIFYVDIKHEAVTRRLRDKFWRGE